MTARRLIRFGWARQATGEAAGLLVADVEADAFCHHMVRALVGALLPVGEGSRPVSWPAQVLAAAARDSNLRQLFDHALPRFTVAA